MLGACDFHRFNRNYKTRGWIIQSTHYKTLSTFFYKSCLMNFELHDPN